jgi:hypothetical protein
MYDYLPLSTICDLTILIDGESEMNFHKSHFRITHPMTANTI